MALGWSLSMDGVFSIPAWPKRFVLPKLRKRQPAVLDQEKLGLLFERARGTRPYTVIVLAGCRRGELLA